MTASETDHPSQPVIASTDLAFFADILCAIDGGPESLAAVEQATALAGPHGHVTLLLVTSFRFSGDHRSPAIGPTRAKRILDRAVGIVRSAHVSHAVEVDPASPRSGVILDWTNGRDLLAIGAPATSWFESMFSGGVVASAERRLMTPLLIARSSRQRDKPRILVASDGLGESDRLVELAGSLARAQGAEVMLVHATGSGSASRRRRVAEQAHRLELAHGDASEFHLAAGSARTAIVEQAHALDASLVLMSSRRLRGVREIGSVSRRVVHEGPCSVLLVPPERLAPG